jgi:hypothetical protein
MRRYLPVLVLFVLAPLVAEVLLGATTLSRIGGLLPVSLLYGGGAVLIRELVRRREASWGRIALLGAAYALVEEGLAIQSLFNPDLFNAGILGGRALGVNWVWSQWTVGYHVVWSIIIPILLAELLFPARRAEPWLGQTGVALAGVVYILGALAIAAIFWLVITPNFRAPLVLLGGTALLIIGLVAVALHRPAIHTTTAAPEPILRKEVPGAWLVGVVGAVVAVAWFALLGLPETLRVGALVLVPMLGELALVAGVVALIHRWSARRGWSDSHDLALACGPLLASMLFGFFFVTAGNRVDQLGQGIASVVAVALLARFARRLQEQRRGGAADALQQAWHQPGHAAPPSGEEPGAADLHRHA